MPAKHAAIVGAGIAGLTAALALARRGISSEIFEQAPELTEVGAGLQISPNASRILAELGVLARLTDAWLEPDSIQLISGTSLRRLAAVPAGSFARARWGAPYGVLHRSTLQQTLLDAVANEPLCQMHLGAQIKGRPTQTYLRPDRKWIFGTGSSRIYYYKYFEPADGVMVDVHVYELEPNTFRLQRHVFAERARWEPALNAWIFQDGWWRDFKNGTESAFTPFKGQTSTFAEMKEPPSYFLKEVKQDKQMNFEEAWQHLNCQGKLDPFRIS